MPILDIPGIVALIVSISTFIIMWRKANQDLATSDAEAADKYASASSKVAEQNEKLLQRIELLETRQASMLKSITEMNGRLVKRDALLREWQQGIRSLIDQMCDARLTPRWKPKTGELENLDKDKDQ